MRRHAELPMNSTQAGFSAPFRSGYRASGVLLHVTSLPSRYGIGDVGPSAFAWVDQLSAAGQGWWQVLPLGPTGCDHSPYQALSSFAANQLVTSPDNLMEDGLLKSGDCEECSFPSDHVVKLGSYLLIIYFLQRAPDQRANLCVLRHLSSKPPHRPRRARILDARPIA